ncbi:MAG: DCC1-like thiol-disulfide oxidoreductase family protein [Planctomycetota bacterium]
MPEMIYYDGDCGLCHRWVKFVMPRDRDGDKFAFSPINSGTFNQRIPAEQRESLPDSILVQREDGTLLARSSAVFHILRRLGGGWKLLVNMLSIIPRPVRDWGYDRVAAVRHRFFKKPTEVCPVMPPELRSRFHF